LITAHDAFEYFGRSFQFEVVGLQGISTVSEAGVADVRALANLIIERKIPAIFIESSVPVRNIEALLAAVKAKGFDVKTGGELYSDALGSKGTAEGTYTGMYLHNVTTIVDALSGK
jgi:manganese/zinc/iron transport system substrate-binding protein